MNFRGPLTGVVAAAFTPLTDSGERPDAAAIGPYVEFLAAGGVEGVFALGSTGEGFLLDRLERRQVVEAFREATAGRLKLAVHAGAQTTRETVQLASDAQAAGADAVAVIAPPYYPLRGEELVEYFAAAAEACAPLPFYAYEFAARSGYAVPVEVIARLPERAPNFVGLKVSDPSWESVTGYMTSGVDVLVGYEPFIPRALAAGAAGAISGLAAVFPDEVVAVVQAPSEQGARHLDALRQKLGPVLPNGKVELAGRGLMTAAVRAPLRAG